MARFNFSYAEKLHILSTSDLFQLWKNCLHQPTRTKKVLRPQCELWMGGRNFHHKRYLSHVNRSQKKSIFHFLPSPNPSTSVMERNSRSLARTWHEKKIESILNKNKNGVTKGPSSHEQPSDVSGIHQQNDYASLKRRPQRRSKRIRQETRVCWPNSRKNPKFTTELFEQNALSEFRLGPPNGKNHIKQLVSLTRYLTSSHSLTLKESTHFLYKKKGETWIFSENNTFAGDVFTLDRAAGNSLIFCNKLAKNEDVCCLARPVQFLVSIFLSGFFFYRAISGWRRSVSTLWTSASRVLRASSSSRPGVKNKRNSRSSTVFKRLFIRRFVCVFEQWRPTCWSL